MHTHTTYQIKFFVYLDKGDSFQHSLARNE